jgi:hypothetical protein
MQIYFETSAVNYLSDLIFRNPSFGSLATRKLQIEKGRKWRISNVVLWEIFLTKDEQRRYDLFDLARCLFYDSLICSPEEIIINYIQNGCPVVEKQYKLDSQALFSREWTMACKNQDYAFQLNRDQLEDYTTHLRFMGEYFVKTSKGYSLKTIDEFDEVSSKITGAFLQSMVDKLLEPDHRAISDESKNYVVYSLQVVMIILCYGIGFNQPIIEQFWNKHKKTEPLERLAIAVNNFPEIFFRGPLANITQMIILQSKNKSGRGLYFDSLHSIYMTYSDLFITNDEHFFIYKNENNHDPNMTKVTSIKDLNFFIPSGGSLT